MITTIIIITITIDIKRYENNYNNLQIRRASDVREITFELKKLRDIIVEVEDKMAH